MALPPTKTDYKKIAARPNMSGQQIAKSMVPGKQVRTGPLASTPSITGYSKMTPADASGKGQIGMNIFSMGKPKP